MSTFGTIFGYGQEIGSPHLNLGKEWRKAVLSGPKNFQLKTDSKYCFGNTINKVICLNLACWSPILHSLELILRRRPLHLSRHLSSEDAS